MLSIRQPQNGDASLIQLRAIDIKEIYAVSGRTPQAALQNAFERSPRAWVITKRGEPIAAFGVGAYESHPGLGCPWLLASDELEKHPQFIGRTSRKYLNEMTRGFSMLTNYVHKDNTRSIQWLTWLGFSLGEDREFSGEPFIQFMRYQPCVI